MKVSNALKEVWGWKDAVYEETKNMDRKEVVRYFHKSVDRLLDKMGYKKIEISNGIYGLNKDDKIHNSR
ncbi:MAG: hypothetical protein QME42_09410 [bacterium]|nr:hypothetical protein [bacterium]